jgi:hypothetical protein
VQRSEQRTDMIFLLLLKDSTIMDTIEALKGESREASQEPIIRAAEEEIDEKLPE